MIYSPPSLPRTFTPAWWVAGACSLTAAPSTVASLRKVMAGVFSPWVEGGIGGHGRCAMPRKFPQPVKISSSARAFKLGLDGRSAPVIPGVSALFHRSNSVWRSASNVVRTLLQSPTPSAASDPEAKAGGFRVGGKFIHANGQAVRGTGQNV